MDNERLVEQYVRRQLILKGFAESQIEEQSTINTFIAKGLSEASKAGTGYKGFPEFIIRFPGTHDTVMLIECKASRNKHVSLSGNEPVDYAVDGVLHYARALSLYKHHVISVAVSGCATPTISTFIVERNDLGEILIVDLNCNIIESPPFYLRIAQLER